MHRDEKCRYLYIDNLRLLMIILVVLVHLAVTYSGIGKWPFMDAKELDTVGTVFFALFQTFTQGYFMGFMFLISGYFVAASYNKKGCGRFLGSRFIRLGLPALLFMLVISPFISYVILGSTWDRPEFLTYYSDYITSLKVLSSTGPLWFAVALLIFNLGYCVIRIITGGRFRESEKVTKVRPMPGDWCVILLGIVISITTFLIRLVQPVDSSIMNMQICFFAQYIIMFVIGVRAGRYDWFSQISMKRGKKWLIIAFVPCVIVWLIVMLTGGALEGNLDIYKGGMNWQSAAYATWESFVCVSMSVGLIGVFRARHNSQSRLIKAMSDSSFSVYVFHALVIIMVSLLIRDFEMYPILKFAVAAIIGVPLTFLVSHFIFRRVPGLKKIL